MLPYIFKYYTKKLIAKFTMYSRPLNTKNSITNYKMKGELLMLNETMWNIFKETGNIYAYLYTKDYDKHCSNNNTVNKKAPLEMKEITII